MNQSDSKETEPPKDTQAELIVIGSMLTSERACIDVIEILSEGDFYSSANAEAFAAIRDMHTSQGGVDAGLLRIELQKRGALGIMGGAGYLSRALACAPSPALATEYAKVIRDRALNRQIREASLRVSEAASSMDPERERTKALRDLDYARERLSQVKFDEESPEDPRALDIDVFIQETEPEIPSLIEGFAANPSVNIIFGPSGSGKSWALGEIAQAIASPLDDITRFLGQIMHRDPNTKLLWAFGSEDSARRVRARMRKTWLNSIYGNTAPREGSVRLRGFDDTDTDEGFERLRREIEAHRSTALIVDTVSSATSRLKISDNDEVKSYLKRFHFLRDEMGVSSFLTTHTRKAQLDSKGKTTGGNFADSMLGAQAWRGQADSLLLISAEDGNTDDIRTMILKQPKDLSETMPRGFWSLNKDTGRLVQAADPDEEDTYNDPQEVKRLLMVQKAERTVGAALRAVNGDWLTGDELRQRATLGRTLFFRLWQLIEDQECYQKKSIQGHPTKYRYQPKQTQMKIVEQ